MLRIFSALLLAGCLASVLAQAQVQTGAAKSEQSRAAGGTEAAPRSTTAARPAAPPALDSAQVALAEKRYAQHCVSCHGVNRLGGMGPALLPENLARLKPAEAKSVIAAGRPATQMPAFADKLTPGEVETLAAYVYQPPAIPPVWSLVDIKSSHIVNFAPNTLPDKPVFSADMDNLFIVVELGDHHATLLDGVKFEPIHRFPTRFALHGGPKYSPDGRYVYFASRDGWISKFDIFNLKTVAEIRAGINTRNLAVSFDGRYAIAANYLPRNLVILDAETLAPLQVIDAGSRVSAVYTAPPRNSFIAAMKDLKEVWEIPYDKPAADGSLTIRKITTGDYLDDFFFDQNYTRLIGASRDGKTGQVLDLGSGAKVADIPLGGMPHLGSGITFQRQGKTVLATPHLNEGKVTVIDMSNWQVIKQIETLGPGFFMRSHDSSPYAWVDVFFGPNKENVHVIDKETLTIRQTLRPAPGKTAAHVEFTKDGRYALLSIWDDDGAIIVYDSKTLKEIKRIPMKKPSGKYNVYNKTRYQAGTSH